MKNRRYLFKYLLLFIIGVLSFFIHHAVLADSNGDNVGFTITPNYNTAQKKDSSFFDMTVVPSSKQNISITITNTSKDSSKFQLEVLQASTNDNGLIDYSDPKGKISNVPFKLSEHTSYEKNIQLESGQTKNVPIQISIPEQPFKGEVLGGVNVTKVVPENKKQTQLINQYSYVVGLRMRESEENPERNLSAGEANPRVVFGKTGVEVLITNTSANSIGKLKVESLLKRDGKEVKKDTYRDREIAPNSIYPYTLSWDRKDYLPGNYRLTILVSDAKSHKWVFNKEFTLKAEEIKRVKNATFNPTMGNNTWIWIVIALFIILIVLLVGYILYERHKDSKKGGK